MPHRRRLDTNVDERMLDFDGVPGKPAQLAEGHALLATVPTLAAHCLETYNNVRTEAAAATTAAFQPVGPMRATKSRRVLRPRTRPGRPTTPLRGRDHGHRRNSHGTTVLKRRGRVQAATVPTAPTTPDAENDNDNSPALACPFYKHDPVRHRVCALSAPFPDVRRVKQHVIVSHHAPIYCPICGEHFPSAVARDAHARERTCALVDLAAADAGIEGATEEQVEALLRRGCGRNGGGRDDETVEEAWFRMWEVLFPGAPRPATAYLASPAEREVVALRRFWRRAGPGVVRGLLGPGAEDETVSAAAGSVLSAMVEQAGWYAVG